MAENNENYKVIGTKVSPEFYQKFRRICHKVGMKVYDVLQYTAETFVRYTDDRHNLSPEMERLIRIFEQPDSWRNVFNLADPTDVEKEIGEAIYFLSAKGKKGARAILVRRPFMGQWSETVNVQFILERVIEVLLPERYRQLRAMAVELDCNSLLDLLDHLIDVNKKGSDLESIRKIFEDSQRADNTRNIDYGNRRISHKHYDIDGKGAQRIIEFSNMPEIETDKD